MTATATTSKKFAFTYDHVNKKIVGTDINFQKAGIPGSALEAELTARMAERPSYTFRVIETEKKPAKQTYAGLNTELMKAYINMAGNELQKATIEHMVNEKIAYPTIKSWFLGEFKNFNVSKAKSLVAKHKLTTKKEAIHATVKVKVEKAAKEKAHLALVDTSDAQTAEMPVAVNQ